MWFEVFEALVTSFWMVVGITIILGLFVLFSIAISYLYKAYDATKDKARGYSSLKTVTFGDESSVVANRIASIPKSCWALNHLYIFGDEWIYFRRMFTPPLLAFLPHALI